MHSVIINQQNSKSSLRSGGRQNKGQSSQQLFSSICLLLLMASPWKISASASSSMEENNINTVAVSPNSPLSAYNGTLPSATSVTTSTGIAALKAVLSSETSSSSSGGGESEKAVGHLEIRDASGEPHPEKDQNVKYASGLWLARSKRSASPATAMNAGGGGPSKYLHHNMPWKRRPRSKQYYGVEDVPDHHGANSLVREQREQMSSESESSENSADYSLLMPEGAPEMLLAAGRSMAVQMMKKRRPPGGNGGGSHRGRMYDVPQIGKE